MNQIEREIQLNAWLEKNRKIVAEAQNEKERDYIPSMWAGFLGGLRITNAITRQEYNAYYNDLKSLTEELEPKRAYGGEKH